MANSMAVSGEHVREVLDRETAAWPVLAIDRQRRGSLVDQIVEAIIGMVNRRILRVGTKMPSVRQFAKVNGVSTFTVVESYDRLLHLGVLSSRRGSGFFVARCALDAPQPACAPAAASSPPVDALTPDLYSGQSDALPVAPAGCRPSGMANRPSSTPCATR